MTSDREIFVLNLILFRKAAGYSQESLARLISTPVRTYQRFESGESIPKVDVIKRIADATKTNVNEFFNTSAHHELLVCHDDVNVRFHYFLETLGPTAEQLKQWSIKGEKKSPLIVKKALSHLKQKRPDAKRTSSLGIFIADHRGIYVSEHMSALFGCREGFNAFAEQAHPEQLVSLFRAMILSNRQYYIIKNLSFMKAELIKKHQAFVQFFNNKKDNNYLLGTLLKPETLCC